VRRTKPTSKAPSAAKLTSSGSVSTLKMHGAWRCASGLWARAPNRRQLDQSGPMQRQHQAATDHVAQPPLACTQFTRRIMTRQFPRFAWDARRSVHDKSNVLSGDGAVAVGQ